MFRFVSICGCIAVAVSKSCDIDWDSKPNADIDADRVYYIGCTEVEWDYAPSGKNLVSGETIVEGMEEAIWLLGNGEDRIGRKYLKGLYREYTDDCFDELKPRCADDLHLGALGPNIRGLTDEVIKVYYKNLCRFPNSLHVHGLQYDKLSEGAPYHDGSTDGDIVQPGDGWVYVYHVRDSQVDDDVSSQMWLYHSHVDEVRDIYTGLFGAIIITRQGEEIDDDNLRPKDVDREFTTFMVLYDENESLLVDANYDKYLGGTPPDAVLEDEDFIESNLMHAINGYLFGNLDTLTCTRGEKVRWYTASFGNEGDGPHSPHWHGNIAYDAQDHNTDTVVLIPGTTKDVTMTIDSPGKWLYHCHVHDHIQAGMITTYTADDPDGEFCCTGNAGSVSEGCLGIIDRYGCVYDLNNFCSWDMDYCRRDVQGCGASGTACHDKLRNGCCLGCGVDGQCL